MPIEAVRWINSRKDVYIDRIVDRSGNVRFAIRNKFGECFTKDGVFCYEQYGPENYPEYLESWRWTDFDDACAALLKAESMMDCTIQ
ncbi:hypothetical protein D3C87_587540 [compost metagenome]